MTRSTMPSHTAVLMILLLFAGTAAASMNVSVYAPGPGAGAVVFPKEARAVSAEVSSDSPDKLKAEFVWRRPDGSVHVKHVKLGFPSGGRVTVNDTVDPEGVEGWWTVDILAGGRTHSSRFLVTSEAAILGFAETGREGRISALGGTGLSRDLLDMAMADPDEDVRAAAVNAAVESGPGVFSEVLDLALDDGSPNVRRTAVRSFAAAGGDYSAYEDMLVSDPVEYVREAYVDYLRSARPPESTDALGALVTDPADGVRRAAVDALAESGGKDAVAALVKGFAVKDAEFRSRLLGAIIGMEPDNLAAIMSERLSDTSPDIRSAAFDRIEGVSGWDTSRALPLLVMEDERLADRALMMFMESKDSGALLYALGSQYPEIRRKALYALRVAGGEPYFEALTKAVSDGDRYIRLDAVKQLAGFKRRAAGHLIAVLDDEDDAVRHAAAGCLLDIMDPSSATAMLGLTSDHDPVMRLYGLGYLDKTDDKALAGTAAGLVDDPDPVLRSAAIGVAAGRDDPAFSSILSAVYAGGKTDERFRAVRHLAQREDAYALATLIDSLDDPDDTIRLIAVKYVREKDPGKLPVVLVSDEDQEVKREALEAMTASPGNDVSGALVELVTDQNAATRMLALDILEGVEGDMAGKLVSRLIDDSMPDIRKRARALVYTRPDSGVLEGLSRLAVSPERDLRSKSAVALRTHPCEDIGNVLALMARSSYKDSRLSVLDVLAGCKPTGSDAVLAGLAGDPEFQVRLGAVKLLSGVSTRQSETLLYNALSDTDGRIRHTALEALITRGSTVHRDLLPRLVLDPDPKVAGLALDDTLRIDDAGLKTRALVAAAGGRFREYAIRAVDALITTADAQALDVLMHHFDAGYRRMDIVGAVGRMAGEPAVEALDRVYRESPEEEGLRRLAVRSLAGRVGAGPAVAGMIHDALDDPSPEVRLAALESAAAVTDEDTRGRLYARAVTDDGLRKQAVDLAFRDGGQSVLGQVSAAVACVVNERMREDIVKRLAAAKADERLLLIFADDPSAAVRMELLEALSGRTGPGAAYGILRTGSTSSPRVRTAALGYLAKRPREELESALDRMFREGVTDRRPLMLAIESGAGMGLYGWLVKRIPAGDCESLGAVVEAMAADHGATVQEPLTDSIGRCGRTLDLRIIDALSVIKGDGQPAGGLAALLDSHPEYGVDILDAAHRAGVVDALIPSAAVSPHPAMRRRAVEMLSDGSAYDAGTLILNGLGDPDASVRMAAADTAARLGRMDELTAAADDSRPYVRLAAVRGLTQFNSPQAYGIIASLAGDGNREVAGASLDALAGAGDGVPASLWAGILESATAGDDARLTAVKKLSRTHDPAYAELLAGLLGSHNPGIAGEAAAGLVTFGVPSLTYVHPMLQDARSYDNAMRVVAGISDSSSVPVLAGMLGHAGPEQKAAIIGALGKVGGEGAQDALVREYGSGDEASRVAVLKAVSYSGHAAPGAGITGIIRSAIGDRDDDVRFYGVFAAGRLKAVSLKGELERLRADEDNRLILRQIDTALGQLGEGE